MDRRGRAWIYLVVIGFKVHRRLIAESAVEPLSVIKGFNVIKDGGLGLGSAEEGLAIDQFELEGASEAFHRGIIIAIS